MVFNFGTKNCVFTWVGAVNATATRVRRLGAQFPSLTEATRDETESETESVSGNETQMWTNPLKNPQENLPQEP